MNLNTLEDVARAIVADGRGILAADESSPTIAKRFASIDVPSTEENRRFYREMLFTTVGAERYIGGVILFDETARQRSDDGRSFVDLLTSKGMVPGIKVDKGAKALAGARGETVTEGLDGLRDRLTEYRGMGLRFAKWRAVIAIGDGLPSDYCIEANAQALARYAALCIEQDVVPIVEPEVLMNGTHDIHACREATNRTLQAVFSALVRQRVKLEQILLKPNMVLSGLDCSVQAGPEEVARATVDCFRTFVPASVPGIVFLSGGQTEEEATRNLNAMNALGENVPWPLSFSYGRALQASALKTWSGQVDRAAAGQEAFHKRAWLNGAAARGAYSAEMEDQAVPV